MLHQCGLVVTLHSFHDILMALMLLWNFIFQNIVQCWFIVSYLIVTVHFIVGVCQIEFYIMWAKFVRVARWWQVHMLTVICIFCSETCNSCNMDMRDLPDMYAQGPRATGPRAESIHTRQIMNGHVTSIYYVSLCSHSNNTSSLNSTSNCHTCSWS